MTILASRASLTVAITFLVAVCIAFALFTGGGFVFDDIPNLSQLARIQADGSRFWDVVLSNNSGPTGRPVAMYFLALQHSDWPSSPAAFQLVNILIHALNSLLVYRLFYLLFSEEQLLKTPLPGLQKKLFSVLGAAFWAFHPGNVSSVLYIIQRMNLLSVLFGLCALIGVLEFLRYSRLNNLRFQSEPLSSGGSQTNSLTEFFLLLLFFFVMMLLSVFSKENGILFAGLLPLAYFLGFKDHPTHHRSIRWLTFALCIVSFSVFLAVSIDFAVNGYGPRDYTLAERCLTQLWVTSNYISWFWFPSYLHFYFFHDDIAVITSLNDPRLLVSFGVWLVLLCIAWKFRLFRFGLAWFAVSHLLESTIVPLEMVFEHRNYLATIGFSFVLASMCVWLYMKASGVVSLAVFAGIGFFWVVNFSMVAQSWSSRENMATYWSHSNPHSVRLYAMKGDVFTNLERYSEAEAEFKKIITAEPTSVMGYLSLLGLQCVYPAAAFSWSDFSQRAAIAKYEASIINVLGEIMTLRENGGCSYISNGYFWAVLKVLRENPKVSAGRAEGNFLLLEGRLCFEAEDYNCFLERFEAAALKLKHFSILDNLGSVYTQLYGAEAAHSYIERLKIKMEKQD